jgi:NAD+ synthase
MNSANVVSNIHSQLRSYVEQHKLKSLVLGVSGGIDSALCAALARPVCDYLGIELIGRSITIASNKREEVERAAAIGKAFCTNFKEEDFGHDFAFLVKLLLEDDEPGDLTFERKVRRGNLKARLRMIRLYDVASKYHGMVLSTDNLTELLLGFWTLNGDVGCYGMIQQLWKTEVFELAKHVAASLELDGKLQPACALRACALADPTDGLGITNTDLEQLGAGSYAEVDSILKCWVCDDSEKFIWDDSLKYQYRASTWEEHAMDRDEFSDHPVVLRNISSEFKRHLPVNLTRKELGLE